MASDGTSLADFIAAVVALAVLAGLLVAAAWGRRRRH